MRSSFKGAVLLPNPALAQPFSNLAKRCRTPNPKPDPVQSEQFLTPTPYRVRKPANPQTRKPATPQTPPRPQAKKWKTSIRCVIGDGEVTALCTPVLAPWLEDELAHERMNALKE